MLETFLISAAVLLAIVFTVIGRKKEAGHQNAVTEIKSEIADSTNMTAKIAVFSDGRRTTSIIAASEETGAFFYYKVVGPQVMEKYAFGLNRIIQSKLYINGQDVPFGNPAGEVVASAFAHEASTSETVMFGSAKLAAIRNMTIEISYQSEDRPKILAMGIVNMPTGEAVQQMGRLVENAVWWAAFLRAASSMLQMMAEEEAARVRLESAFATSIGAAEVGKAATVEANAPAGNEGGAGAAGTASA